MMARLVVVGSGTVVPEADRGGACFFLEMDGALILLDCGPGAVQGVARCAVPWQHLTDLIVTHFHTDHIGGLPGLFFALKYGMLPAKRKLPLTVWGPPGTGLVFDRLAAAFGEHVLDPGFPVRIREITPGEFAEIGRGIAVSACHTPHTVESQGVRLDGARCSVGYTGDTGPSDSLGSFMRTVSLLVCECSFLNGQAGQNHLSPSGVARIAAAARPARLLITHIYPHVRSAYDVGVLVRDAGYESGAITIAKDGLELLLESR